MNFDILKITHGIEESRLVLGKKIEKFLLKKLNYGKNLVMNFFKNKKSALYGSAFIILLSLFLQSTRDLGEASASSIYKFPILIEIANYLKLNVIIFTEILINFCGIISIYLSYKILEKSELSSNYTILNLLTWGFCAGFFLRNYDFYGNEVFTESAVFLIFFYPLFSLALSPSPQPSPLKGEGWGEGDRAMIAIIIIFASIIFILPTSTNFPEIKSNIYPILLFLFLLKNEIHQNKLLKKLFFITILASILSSITGNFTILQSLFLPQIFLTFYFISPKINFKKDWVFIIPILIIFHFNSDDVTLLTLNLCFFWWVFALLFCHPRLRGDDKGRRGCFIFCFSLLYHLSRIRSQPLHTLLANLCHNICHNYQP